MKVVDGYDTNFVLYCSFDRTEPGNGNGFWRKFEGVRGFEVESRSGGGGGGGGGGGRFVGEKILYCSLYSEVSDK